MKIIIIFAMTFINKRGKSRMPMREKFNFGIETIYPQCLVFVSI